MRFVADHPLQRNAELLQDRILQIVLKQIIGEGTGSQVFKKLDSALLFVVTAI